MSNTAADTQTKANSPSPAESAGRNPDRGQSAQRRRRLAVYIYPAAAIVVVLTLWDAAIRVFQIPHFVVAPPLSVLAVFRDQPDLLLSNLWPTLLESVIGFLLGNLVAIILAILFVQYRSLETALFPLAIAVKATPIIGIAPILVLMLGYGYAPKIVIASLITFFPTLVNVVRGLKTVDKATVELFAVLSATRSQILWKLRVFNAVPFLFSALKITAPIAVIGAIIAEWIGSQSGLGYLIIDATYNFRTPLLYATMIVSSLLAILFVVVIVAAEKLVVRWEQEDPSR